MASVTIRAIEKDDVEAVFAMMRDLAAHENETEYLITNAERLAASGFGAEPQWRGFIAYQNGDPAGYATYTADFHIWSGRRVINLDDLFVVKAARGRGVGEALMRRVFALIDPADGFVTWSVQRENARAIAFYKKLGAQIETLGKCYWGLK